MAKQRRHLGEIIYQAGLVEKKNLIKAIQTAAHSDKRLGEILLERGLIDEDTLAKCIAKQFDMEYIDLDTTSISTEAAKLIPEDLVKEHNVIPMEMNNGRLKIIIGDPTDLEMMDAIRFRLNTDPQCYLASLTKIRAFINETYAPIKNADESTSVSVDTHDHHGPTLCGAKTYEYTALDSQGEEIKGEVEAWSQKEAILKIRNMGCFPTSVHAPKRIHKTKTQTVKSRFKKCETCRTNNRIRDILCKLANWLYLNIYSLVYCVFYLIPFIFIRSIGMILSLIRTGITESIKHPQKAILPILGLLFIFAIACWLIFNSIKDKREENDKRLQTERSVEYLVLKHDAIVDWREQFREDDSPLRPIYTVELEKAVGVGGSRSIMFFSAVQDVAKKGDSFSVSFSHLAESISEFSMYYVLDCTQTHVDEIMSNLKNGNDRFLESNYAVIAKISSVKKVRFKLDVDAPDQDGDGGSKDVSIETGLYPFDYFIAKGVCLDLLYLGDYKFWEYRSK